MNLCPALNEMQERPNIKGKQFRVFEFLILLINPKVCNPHKILCVFDFKMSLLLGLEITSDSIIHTLMGTFQKPHLKFG